MTSGIKSNTTNLTINGVHIGRAIDAASDLLCYARGMSPKERPCTADEIRVAKRAARRTARMKAKGYKNYQDLGDMVMEEAQKLQFARPPIATLPAGAPPTEAAGPRGVRLNPGELRGGDGVGKT